MLKRFFFDKINYFNTHLVEKKVEAMDKCTSELNLVVARNFGGFIFFPFVIAMHQLVSLTYGFLLITSMSLLPHVYRLRAKWKMVFLILNYLQNRRTRFRHSWLIPCFNLWQSFLYSIFFRLYIFTVSLVLVWKKAWWNNSSFLLECNHY